MVPSRVSLFSSLTWEAYSFTASESRRGFGFRKASPCGLPRVTPRLSPSPVARDKPLLYERFWPLTFGL